VKEPKKVAKKKKKQGKDESTGDCVEDVGGGEDYRNPRSGVLNYGVWKKRRTLILKK